MEKSRFASEDVKERELISLMLNPRSSLKWFSFLKQSHGKKNSPLTVESFHVVLARTPPCLNVALPCAASSIARTGPGRVRREVSSFSKSHIEKAFKKA